MICCLAGVAGVFSTSLALSPTTWPLMSHESTPTSPGTCRSAKQECNDELDANIRNFAPVARIMKNALPDNAKIAKEAKECMQECVSEFISFITSEGESTTHVVYPLLF